MQSFTQHILSEGAAPGKNMFIYRTTNNLNGKQYIGMCSHNETGIYLGSGTILKKAIRKYGRENFSRETIQECDSLSELCESEERWIDIENAVEDPNYYNLSRGGFGGNSNSMKEYWAQFSSEERKNIRSWAKPQLGKPGTMLGKRHSEETKRKIGAKSVNRNWISYDKFGAKNPRAKPCRVTWNGKTEEFGCLKEFAELHRLPYSTIKGVAKQPTTRGKYSGLLVEWIN